METRALADFHVLIAPRHFFREYIKQQSRADRRLLWQRPVFTSLAIAVAASLTSTHSVSAGLILSTVMLWLVLPLIQIIALFAVVRNQLNGYSRAKVMDAFLVTNLPWLLWLALWGCIQTWLPLPTAMHLWRFWFPGGCLVALLWSGWLDFAFFCHVLARTMSRAWLDVLLQRLIAWSLFLAVFEYGAVIPTLREIFG